MGFFALAICLVTPDNGVTCNHDCNQRQVFETCAAVGGVPAGTVMVYEDSTCIRCVGSNLCAAFGGSPWTCIPSVQSKRAQPGWIGAPSCTCAVGLRNVTTRVQMELALATYNQNVTRYICNGPWGTNPDYDDEALTPVVVGLP